MTKILVTGGAGYIGSHLLRLLKESKEDAVAIDNLSTGFEDAIEADRLIVGDIADEQLLKQVFKEHSIETVMHLAASTSVPESINDPLKYYRNNFCNTQNLLACCVEAGVKQFIFSSTAAVYGNPDVGMVSESSPCLPINAYGTSKLYCEKMIQDVASATGMRFINLRYFNVAGADIKGRAGDRKRGNGLLISTVVQSIVKNNMNISVYGTDYPTTDGTAIRDYVHVDDIAAAHINALQYLRQGGESQTLNCGYGHGYSVREVLDEIQRQIEGRLVISESGRRDGDPASLIADTAKIKAVFDWVPRYDNLDVIIKSALEWERKLSYA